MKAGCQNNKKQVRETGGEPPALDIQLKKETGTSFTETVRKFKIMHVKELLLDTDLKLNQIAAMTGFSNPKYMSKVFKQEEGMLPNEYRRINA